MPVSVSELGSYSELCSIMEDLAELASKTHPLTEVTPSAAGRYSFRHSVEPGANLSFRL